jgi:succinoglycan biosynthesis transport protein ExoP
VENQQEPSFRDLVELIRKGLLLALLVAVSTSVATYLLSTRLDPTYRARATLLASQPSTDTSSFGVSLVTAPPVDVAAYEAAATSSPVLRTAMTEAGLQADEPQELASFRKRMKVRTEETRLSSLVHVEVEGEDPAAITSETNAIARSLLGWDTNRATRNLENIISTLEAQMVALDSQISDARGIGTEEALEQLEALQNLRADLAVLLNSARALRNSAVGRLEILEPALVPLEPVAPSPVRNAALAFVLGVFLTYGLLLLRDALDVRIKGTEDLARTSKLPVLAEFPKQTGVRRLPREASGYLRTNLHFLTASAHPKVILVTSSNSSHGKSSVALSLAESLARNDHRTLLVDADLRKPVLGAEYGLDPRRQPALQVHLENPHHELAPARVAIDKNTFLDVIPSFESAADPSELLSRGFQSFLRRQSERYDAIVIDSAPILPVADTLTMAPHVTGVVFAVSLADADRRFVSASLELLERLGVRLLGTVATNLGAERARNGKAYGYGYGYGSGHALEETPKTGDTRPVPGPASVG